MQSKLRWRFLRFLFTSFGAVGLLVISLLAIVYWLNGPSRACNHPTSPPLQPGKSARTLISGGLQRCYLLYLPSNYTPDHPTAVVVSLHGLAANPEGQEAIAKWDAVADTENFVVVYPQGTSFPLRWNAASAYNVTEIDDVGFFRDVVKDLENILSVDMTRIYVTGFSNGGAMTNRIACEATELVAAVGTVSAAFVEAPNGCNPVRSISVIAFHGTADPVVNYMGGTSEASVLTWLMNLSPTSTPYPSIEAWGRQWAERNACDLVAEPISATGDASGIRYQGCHANTEVIVYTIEGGGHAWPGGEPIGGIGKTSIDISASQTMWEFFKAHAMSGEP